MTLAEELLAVLAVADQKIADRDALVAQIDLLTEEIVDLRNDLDNSSLLIAELQAALSTANEQIAFLTAEVARLQAIIDGMEPNEAPVNLTLPTISGEPRVGNTLTAIGGTWDGGTGSSFSWVIDGIDSPGSTLVLAEGDEDSVVTLKDTRLWFGGVVSALSLPVVVLPALPVGNDVTITDITQLNSAITQVGPGGIVRVVGVFNDPPTVSVNVGGTEAGRVTVDFIEAEFIGIRTPTWVLPVDITGRKSVRSSWVTGRNFLSLQEGANYLTFKNFKYKLFARALSLVGNIHHFTLDGFDGFNCQDHVYQNYTAPNGCHDVEIKNGRCLGYSKSAVRLNGDSHDVLVENVYADSGFQLSDQFAMGFFCSDTAHDITFRNCESQRNVDVQSYDDSKYWNGDGFVHERGNYNLTFEDCYAHHNSDGGYDGKGDGDRVIGFTNVNYIRCRADNNKHNWRLWDDAVLNACVAADPKKTTMTQAGVELRGGSGSTNNLGIVGASNATADGTTVYLKNGCRFSGGPAWQFEPHGSAGGVVYNATVIDDGTTVIS